MNHWRVTEDSVDPPEQSEKTHTDDLVSHQCTLIVSRHVLTGEVKYFLSNRVSGLDGWTLRAMLRIAFGRWQIEDCFRGAKEEPGPDHFECRGWRCIHRHLYVTLLSGLFCARVRQKLSPSMQVISGELLTTEQVRRAANVFIETMNLPPKARYEEELINQQYYARRNATAAKSHRKKRLKRLRKIGIAPDKKLSTTRRSFVRKSRMFSIEHVMLTCRRRRLQVPNSVMGDTRTSGRKRTDFFVAAANYSGDDEFPLDNVFLATQSKKQKRG